jgi:hypothetical protein
MKYTTSPHFPVAILIHNGELITAAAAANAPIASRLPANYIADTKTALGKLTSDLTSQKNAKGELGPLNQAQRANLNTLQHYMNLARKTARLAFPGQAVKLHQEFQVGVNGQHDVGSFLARADIILASLQNPANLDAIKLRGWADADTTAFAAARQSLGNISATQQSAKGGAKATTGQKEADAADLYVRLLTIQNAADLQWPATDPANAGLRDAFCLNTFPPTQNHGNGQQPPAPAPTPAPQAKAQVRAAQ